MRRARTVTGIRDPLLLGMATEEARLAQEAVELLESPFQRAARQLRENGVPPNEDGFYHVHTPLGLIERVK